MSVVRRGNGNCVNLVIKFGKHLPVVLKGSGTLKLLGPGVNFTMGIIDIAQANHLDIIMLCKINRINTSFSTGTNVSGANFTVWCLSPQAGWKNKKTADCSRRFDEVSACIVHVK